MEIEGMDVVSFETDAQTVVTALQSDVDDRSEFGDIIQRCKDVLAGQVHFSVQFARRSQNRVAHDIARRSCSSTSPFWGEVPPGWMSDFLVDFLIMNTQ
ncbi:hypothetical protein LINPERHAP2_LOCUS9035 [Linum perenne]